jgi:23S rRNA (adenine2503-C2)-methyltransferase
MNILSMTYDQVADEMKRVYGKGAFHAGALYREIYKNGRRKAFYEAPEFAASLALAKQLENDLVIAPGCITASRSDEGGVVKFAITLADNAVVETVIIPRQGRTTLCVSSQIGCRRGCVMCATGACGFVRDLSAQEIVLQVFLARFELKRPIDNVVFMGMGEPFDNFDHVMQAISVLSDQRGFAVARRRITVSTAGHVEGIVKMAALKIPRVRLAVSLHAADDLLRDRLMPINKRYPLGSLKEAFRSLLIHKNDVIFIEYVLLAGINDSSEMADKLATYLHGLRVRINLIAYNPCKNLPFQPPSPERLSLFRDYLVRKKLFVRIRQSYGGGIAAACGQLRATLSPA